MIEQHTPAPCSKCGLTILGPDQLQIAVAEAHPATALECQEANARRIVACVNACAGISTENLEDNVPVKELARRYNEIFKQRDVMLAALERLSLYVAHNGDDWVQREARAAIASVEGETK